MYYFHKNLNPLIVLRYYTFALFILFLPFSIFAQTTSQTEPNVKQINDKAVDSPVSILIIPDISSSMRSESKMRKAVLESLSDFVEKSNSDNEYFIVGISTSPEILLDANTNVEKMQKAISKIRKKNLRGASAFYDTCFLGVEKLSQSKYSEKIAIILSDGSDNISDKTIDELLAFLKNEKVVIYAINVNSRENEISLRGGENLSKITSITGGEVYNVEKSEDIDSIFENIRKKLRQ